MTSPDPTPRCAPQRSSRNRRTRTLCAALAVLSAAGGCKSAEEHREDADRAVYDIIRARRAELEADGAFTIEPAERGLRSRLLAGKLEANEELAFEFVDVLEIAAENSRNYQTRRESLYLVALDLTLERWRFSVQESGSFGAFLDGAIGEKHDSTSSDASGFASLGLSRLLGSGALIVGNIGFDLVRDLSRGEAWDAVSSFSLNVTQPLLRGYGREIVEEPLTQAERDVLYEVRAYERFRRTFAFDVASRFYRLLELVDTLSNEEVNYGNLQELRERNEAFAEAGLLSDIQVDQARQDEFRARNRVVDARRNLEANLDDFKLFLGLPVEASFSLVDSGLEEQLLGWNEEDLNVSEDTAVDIALAERLDHLTTIDRVADAERAVRVAADALRTGLDVGAGVTGSAEGADFDESSLTWDASIDVDLPWERMPQRNAYRESLIRYEAARRSAEESADFVRADVREAQRQLAAARESYEIQTNAVALAERRVESSALNLEAGRASTRDLLEAQEDLLQAKNAATRAQTDYTLAGLALYRDMELLRVTDRGLGVDAAPLQEFEQP